VRHILRHLFLLTLVLCTGCRPTRQQNPSYPAGRFTNPVYRFTGNTAVYFQDGKYYLPFSNGEQLLLCCAATPPEFDYEKRVVAIDRLKQKGINNIWHPQLVRLRGTWYIYLSSDDGNTDNHHIWVLSCPDPDPMTGHFSILGKIVTDPDDNWATYPYAFEYKGELYLLWSGWERRREFMETQRLYIARLADPCTLASERVLISSPDLEWERQWIQQDGKSYTRYPVFVNEAPFFFAPPESDHVWILYSASANWTAHSAIGALHTDKKNDLLDATAWKKLPAPLLRSDADENAFGPSWPYVTCSPDGSSWYLLYSVQNKAEIPYYRMPHAQAIQAGKDYLLLGQ